MRLSVITSLALGLAGELTSAKALLRAASTSPSSGPPANFNGPATNTTVALACLNELADITDVSNAAGWAACYNVLFLNNQTGIFEADLRLYQVSPPSGAFSGIPELSNFVSPAVDLRAYQRRVITSPRSGELGSCEQPRGLPFTLVV